MEEISNKELLDRVRTLLHRDKIRLWGNTLYRYEHWRREYSRRSYRFDNGRQIRSIPLFQDLISSICAELGSNGDEVRAILSHLRRHALEKLAAKQRADWIQLKIRSSAATTTEDKVCS